MLLTKKMILWLTKSTLFHHYSTIPVGTRVTRKSENTPIMITHIIISDPFISSQLDHPFVPNLKALELKWPQECESYIPNLRLYTLYTKHTTEYEKSYLESLSMTVTYHVFYIKQSHLNCSKYIPEIMCLNPHSHSSVHPKWNQWLL